MGEMVAVFIKPDVGLELKVTYSDSEDRAGKFVVTGPKRKLDILKYVAQGIDVDGEIDGVIGPMTPITLPDDVKESAGIPLPSTKFAFLYPLSYFKSRLYRINLAVESWGCVHLLGGFAYFDEFDNLLGVNALTIVPSSSVLHLFGPETPSQSNLQSMKDLGRMTEVVLDGLRDAGFRKFGWVNPGEVPAGGEAIGPGIKNAYGGFMYETEDGPMF